jgi:acyl-CoA reductase-like NAD-dependent aldehyde dehydrogenase
LAIYSDWVNFKTFSLDKISELKTMERKLNFKLKEAYPYYLAGKPVYANQLLKVTDKYTNEVATFVALADSEVINEAIQKAVESQEELNKMSSYQRRDILNHVVEQVKKRHDEFSLSLAIEAGKPLKDAKGEVDRLITTFQIAAEESVRIYGEYSNLDISKNTQGFRFHFKKFQEWK